MSHKIIEKEISWDEFTAFLFEATVLENDGYCFSIKEVRLKDDKIEILTGPYVWNFLLKEENETIKYGLGSFYLNRRQYDEEKDEEATDENGYSIYNTLETYKIVETEIKLHQLKTL
jgi:hypothetical protein